MPIFCLFYSLSLTSESPETVLAEAGTADSLRKKVATPVAAAT
jgi:hypothetical protein